MTRAYVKGLSSGLRGAALPYGYTVTIWGSGQILTSLRGVPNVGQALMFVAGAVAAYGTLKWIAGERPSDVQPQLGSPHLIRAGAIQVSAIGSAVGLAAVLGLIESGVAWPLGGFVASILYIAVTSLELALLEAEA